MPIIQHQGFHTVPVSVIFAAFRLISSKISLNVNYYPLSIYVDTTRDQRSGLEIGQTVLSQLESYPADKLTGQIGAEFAGVIDEIAKRQLLLKQYQEAEQAYQKTLNLVTQMQGIDEVM